MSELAHTIARNKEDCKACVACAKICPTRAIRVYHNVVAVKPELCIDCGECIRACRNNAVFAITSSTSDLKKYKYTVAITSPTLYGQFGANVHPSTILHALLSLGFNDYYDVSWMSEMVGRAIDTYLSEAGEPWPKISVNCPAIIRLIMIRYPDLVPHLIPIETPRELSAKFIRKKLSVDLSLSPEDIGIFFITPCSAIMQSIERPVALEKSHIDGAFSINDVYPRLLRTVKDSDYLNPDMKFSARGILWAMSRGEIGCIRDRNTLAISGVHEVTSVFDRIESGKFLSTDYIEAYICPGGCVSGPLVMEERYMAERNIRRMMEEIRVQDRVSEEKVRALFRQHFFSFEEAIKARPLKPMGGDLKQAIALKKEKSLVLEKLAHKNCAACGAPDCETLAQDIVAGEASPDNCVFIKIENLQTKK